MKRLSYLILIAFLFANYACDTTVTVTNGSLSVTNIPSEVKRVVLTLETEDGILSIKRTVRNGKIGPIPLGPLFARKTYGTGQIKLDTFSDSGDEKNYQNKNSSRPRPEQRHCRGARPNRVSCSRSKNRDGRVPNPRIP